VAGALLVPPADLNVRASAPLCAGDAVSAHIGRLAVTLFVVRADVDGIALARRSGGLRRLEVTGTLVATGAGTLLTYAIEWASAFGDTADAVVGRRRVLATLGALCAAARQGTERLLASRAVVAAAIVRDGRILAQQRGYPGAHAGRWELPGGKVEPGESDAVALARECREELGIRVLPAERIGQDVGLPGGYVLRAHTATAAADREPKLLQHKDLRWLSADELATVDWLPADRALLPALRTLLIGST
jgi:8-oxo-dGTP diphosphatase